MNNPDRGIFRAAALDSQRTTVLGKVLLISPISFHIFAGFGLTVIVGVVLFALVASYTQHATVPGEVVPVGGVVKVFSRQAGTVTNSFVKDGDAVDAGALLLEISSEHHAVGSDVDADVDEELGRRISSLEAELSAVTNLEVQEKIALHEKQASLKLQLTSMSQQAEDQSAHVQIASRNAAQYSKLVQQDLVSVEEARVRESEMLEQRSRLAAVQSNLASLAQNLAETSSDLISSGFRQSNARAALTRQIDELREERAKNKGIRGSVVRAPIAGTITAQAINVGQPIDPSHTLLGIIPKSSVMQVHLYAPSSAIGFVKAQDEVFLRYQAYPYQKFGHGVGTVLSISRIALSATELTNLSGLYAGSQSSNQPLYEITVALSDQTILAYGHPEPLRPGMLLEADLQGDSRRLYEWALEPLYTISGKF